MRRCLTCPNLIPDKGKQKYCPACARARNRARSATKCAERKSAPVLRKHKRKRRICLACNKSFWSEGNWNRICHRCTRKNTGEPQPRSSGYRWNGHLVR